VTPVHEVHSSELRGYRRCRQLWQWRYRDQWEPIRKPAPLEDGTVWHKALEVLYNPETWALELKELYGRAHAALIAEASHQQQAYCDRAGKTQLDDLEAVDYEERIKVLRSMLTKLCRSLDRERFRPIFVEREFSCPIVDLETGQQLYCHCPSCTGRLMALPANETHELAEQAQAAGATAPGLPVVFSCRVDAGFEDREGYVYAVDHKSAANLYKPDSVIPELEDQLPSYLWCLRQSGFQATGIILNQFRKSYPKPPKRLERVQAGRLYSVNRQQLTDYHTARAIFMNHDRRGYAQGLYAEYLEWLHGYGPEFARQFTIMKTPEQLTNIAWHIGQQAKEVIDAGPAIYPNPNQINCERCSFQLPCLSAQAMHDPLPELAASFVQTEPYYIQRRRQS
jgi:PD-(D/E)XK nuclease superfamily